MTFAESHTKLLSPVRLTSSLTALHLSLSTSASVCVSVVLTQVRRGEVSHQVAAHGHWFRLLRIYVEQLRTSAADSQPPEARDDASPPGPVVAADMERVLTHIYSAFMEEVISCMAGGHRGAPCGHS